MRFWILGSHVRHSGGLERRQLLIRSWQTASAALVRAGLGALAPARALTAPAAAEFHLHPHYREQTPLDTALLQTRAGLDSFVIEKHHDQIAATLAEWGKNLRDSPQRLHAIANAMAPGFSGASLRPTESTILRPGPALEVTRVAFASQPSLRPAAFQAEFRSALASFAKIWTADFQVTRIDALPTGFRTRVRYEIVASGAGFHREQRVGFWELVWDVSYRLLSWRADEEIRSKSARPCYDDVSRAVFAQTQSYSAQFLHGVDDWRRVLDAACGIDIYGHNGVSIGDIDNDGFDDLYICQPAGLPNRLYRNRGNGTFEDITETSGVGLLDNTACALFLDVDNDGRQDLVVVRANGPLLFLNQGTGKFQLKPNAFQFANIPQGTFTGASAADYDRDGWLDIYFCLYVYYQGTDQYKYPVPYFDAENGPPNFMMHSNRDGTFRDVTAQCGLDKNNTRYSFCCGWNDFNGDNWPDLYVVNDFGRKNLYRNNGDGTFTDVAAEAGVEDVGAGMSVAWFDYDNDGLADLYSADMWTAAGERISTQPAFKKDAPPAVRALYQKHAMGNSLFHNRGDGAFQDATALSGAGMGRWSWSSDAWDFDHDGFPDLYIANGMISGDTREDLNGYFWRQVVANSPDDAKPSRDYETGWNVINELIRAGHTWSGLERNVFYANNRDGTFSDVSGAIGLDFLQDGRAFALADFDHDGRQEVFLKSRNAPQLRVLRNVMDDLPPSIAFRLRGRDSNRDAIGAVITVETESGRQTRGLPAGSGFLSQHSKEVFFGLGTNRGNVNASIHWPSGLVQQLHALPPNHRVWVEEGLDPHRVEPFLSGAPRSPEPQEHAPPPVTSETWLLSPIPAPDFSLPDAAGRIWTLSSQRGKPLLLTFQAEGGNLRLSAANLSFPLKESDEVAAVYNIVYRYLFDYHRDLDFPASFLIDGNGDIVKVYQGPVDPQFIARDTQRTPQTTAERLDKALPFPGVSTTYEFGRNHLSYGSAFFQRGYFPQAATFFQLALRDDPSSAEALYGLGSVFLKQEKTAQARDSFERAAKANASYPETRPNAWNNLGLLATREGRTDQAISCFQEALKLSPDHLVALQNLGSAYRQEKRWDEARQTLQRALTADPLDPEANYGLAMVFAQTGDSERAYGYLRKALDLRPTYPEALNNLGVLYLRTGRRDDAVASFQQCIRVAPGFDQSYLNLARLYSLEGNSADARTLLKDLLNQHPGHQAALKAMEQLP